MTDDIVKRLRFKAATKYERDAADCIERLRAELAAERERVKELTEEMKERHDEFSAYRIDVNDRITKLREALVEADKELQSFCEQVHGEDYNNLKINAALEQARKGWGMGDIPALDIIEELRAELAAERERANAVCNSYALENQQFHDRFTLAEARVAKLREVLEPFAEIADIYEIDAMSVGDVEVFIDVADLRRARAVLNETGGGDE